MDESPNLIEWATKALLGTGVEVKEPGDDGIDRGDGFEVWWRGQRLGYIGVGEGVRLTQSFAITLRDDVRKMINGEGAQLARYPA